MMLSKKIGFAGAISILAIAGIIGQAGARENIQTSTHRNSGLRTSASGCLPALASIDLDINNVRARLMTGGDMWWDIGQQVASYEVPKNSGHSSQFAASCWIGGYDEQGQLKVAAQTYRQDGNDYWPGALDKTAKITADACNSWDRFWKVDRATINLFIEAYKTGQSTTGSNFDVINQWPGAGNINAKGSTGYTLGLDNNPAYAGKSYAPFKDLNGNGIYEPNLGEYPLITGDQYIWWVFNDAGNLKLQSQTASIGVEVQTSAFAYATQDFLNDATFCNYRVINRGTLTIDSTYIAVWDDCDLGYYLDDFIGCDTTRGLGIQYNGTNNDGGSGGNPPNSYGVNPPQVGLDFFQGPKRIVHRPGKTDTLLQLSMTNFGYYNNDFSVIGNPTNGIQIYGYMTGTIRDGEHFSYDFQGPGIQSKGYGAGPASNFIFWGDPGTGHDWSECTCNNNPGDRRFIFSSGPFQLLPNAINDIVFGCIWAPHLQGCPTTNFKTIKGIDDGAQALFDANFKTTEGPEAPRLVVKELDRRLIFYMMNDYGSNNFAENYGRNDGTYADSLQYHQVVTKSKGISNDSLFHFQGYRVFQLANSQVTSAEIFDQTTGEVDNTKAFEVFQCDISDGVTQIVNYKKNTSISDTTWVPIIKVTGKDSGIVHSFEITQDQFAPSSDKKLVNYHNYYYVAIAYGYNNFANFDALNPNATQDVPYIGSAHGGGGANIVVVSGLPNPSNGAMGTILNADFGSGVSVHRIEGVGNGGMPVQLDSASEQAIINNNSLGELVYMPSQGPIDVKVINPLSVPAYDWVLQIIDTNKAGTISTSATWMLTAVNNNKTIDTIYSELSIARLNEQITEKYGLSISIQQQSVPGANRATNTANGYISSDITFENSTAPWLWGIQDAADSVPSNWLRCGSNYNTSTHYSNNFTVTNPCAYSDPGSATTPNLDPFCAFGSMLNNFSPTKSTWGPYDLAATYNNNHYLVGSNCGFELAYSDTKYQTTQLADFGNLQDVNIVFTPNKADWTYCAVVEEQEDPQLAQGGSKKFALRNHASWLGGISADGMTPIYATDATNTGMSIFPGYAINEETGERLNIVFGEDSYQSSNNGDDMIWNPTATQFNFYDGSIVFGGKHIVYVLSSRYDSDKVFISKVKAASPTNNSMQQAYTPVQWMGVPTLNPYLKLATLKDGIIPTKTTLRFRVTRPYAPYLGVTDTANITVVKPLQGKAKFPYYTFNTSSLAPTSLSDTSNRSNLLSRINVVPNPYYGYSGYETSRFDTKVRIINLPAVTTINIYSLDGSLIRTLTKNDPNTSYIDWDIRNSVGLPIASGMYLMDVKAEGIGETVLRWFGATRPIDVTNY